MIKIRIIKWKKISTKIVIVVFIALLILSSYFVIKSYKDYIKNAEDATLEKLKAIANTVSLNITYNEEDYLNKLLKKGGSKSLVSHDSTYLKIHNYLKNVYQINHLDAPISTLFLDQETQKFYYIAASEDSMYFGDPYIEYSRKFLDNYSKGDVIEHYTDEFGTWLTAFSPILNATGQSAGIIEVDMKFDDFINTANTELYRNLVISIIIFILTAIILLRYVKVVLVSEENSKSQLERLNKEINEKNNDIIQSINYAKKIQSAILPPLDLITEYLPESFVLYKPKDIVSGDFYYFHPTEDPDIFIIAVIDCTGHGVPGALMSMIGNDLLKHIVTDKEILAPGKILSLLNKGVVDALKQEGKYQETKDGMDMALCLINKKDKKLYFSGANRPLFYIEQGVLSTLKPNKMSIGGIRDKKEFDTEEIDYSNKIFYMFTDGYVDQFGGPENKKLMTKKFQAVLCEIYTNPLENQKTILNTHIEEWKMKAEQTDDILVIGFKV
jgi:serine phosphatase RsbU (regulator of sigma subunit)